jgi:hypothetical protein
MVGESGRLAANGLYLRLPFRWPGRITFSDSTADMGSWHRTIPKGSAPAFWDGTTLRIGEMGLGEGIDLQELTLKPLDERLEFGLHGMIGKGILRGDGSLGTKGTAGWLEVTLVGERLGLEAFSGLMKDENRATGTIQQARFTFRGDPGKPLDADSALRLVATNFRWEGKGWESLRIAATLTGHTLTLSEMLLRQGDNELEAEGQSRLPADWRAILRAPFSGTFRATLADAGTLAALAGPLRRHAAPAALLISCVALLASLTGVAARPLGHRDRCSRTFDGSAGFRCRRSGAARHSLPDRRHPGQPFPTSRPTGSGRTLHDRPPLDLMTRAPKNTSGSRPWPCPPCRGTARASSMAE